MPYRVARIDGLHPEFLLGKRPGYFAHAVPKLFKFSD
jgi:hypothetical protein